MEKKVFIRKTGDRRVGVTLKDHDCSVMFNYRYKGFVKVKKDEVDVEDGIRHIKVFTLEDEVYL